MEHAIAVLPDDHQGGEIAGGAEIKTGVGADAGKDICPGRAGAPCGLIYEAGSAAAR